MDPRPRDQTFDTMRSACCASSAPSATSCSRRRAALSLPAVPWVLGLPRKARARMLSDGAAVESFLPTATEDGFYVFTAKEGATPALRAGTLDPYELWLPSGWKQMPVPNAISGNYCQPRCDEPWTEVRFEGPAGKMQVIVSPLVKLTNKPNARIDEVGTPEKLITAFGPYATGDTIDPDEEVVSAVKEEKNGRTYYNYELFTPYALSGAHNLLSVTTSGSVAVLCAASATEKQWSSQQETLKKAIASFTV